MRGEKQIIRYLYDRKPPVSLVVARKVRNEGWWGVGCWVVMNNSAAARNACLRGGRTEYILESRTKKNRLEMKNSTSVISFARV